VDNGEEEKDVSVAVIVAKSNENTNNEEQAGSASEVWRLRQLFGRSDERTWLRLLQTQHHYLHILEQDIECVQ
jgi:hypothetical protein